MALLAMRDVRAGYGGGPDILGGVSLDVEEGSTCCVIGPNGAGKSTVLKAIMGLVDVRAGDIEFAGESLRGRRADEVLARGVCFVPQDRSLFPEMTVRENLAMAGYSLGRRADLDARIGEALDAFPVLAERRSQRARTLSGGQQQMLALAMALMHDPELLLIDELSLGLAPVVVQELLGVVEQLKARGQTMIIVEQSLNVALAFADRAVFMEKGRVRFEGDARELAERDDLVRAVFLGGEGG
jgi:ABC-type branched-subunit amino acid transport system ATPase component